MDDRVVFVARLGVRIPLVDPVDRPILGSFTPAPRRCTRVLQVPVPFIDWINPIPTLPTDSAAAPRIAMIQKPFDQITKDDIEALVRDEEPESRTLEYKQALPEENEDGTRKFLHDVAAFANSGGGDLIFGIQERRDPERQPTALPGSTIGISGINPDTEKRRLWSLLSQKISPRVQGIRIEHFEGFVNGPVIIVRIPRSWRGPHMVTIRDSSRFYTRTDSGNQIMDIDEIRSAFATSEGFVERIIRFRDERLGRIVGGETPILLAAGPRIVVQIVPLHIREQENAIDLLRLFNSPGLVPPLSGGVSGCRFNLEGILTLFLPHMERTPSGYVQVFRNGAIEAVQVRNRPELHGARFIRLVDLELELISSVAQFLRAFRLLGVRSPWFVFVSLIGYRGFNLGIPDLNWPSSEPQPLDRDILVLPELQLVDDGGIESAIVSKTLRPVFDALWQSFGVPFSPFYNPDGTRKPPC